jgi:anti-sigma-K factor RskA
MSEIHGAVGSYVVNALDGAELEEFEAHLAVCPTCQRELVEFSETTTHLSSLVATPPPAALRGSIMAAIGQVRPLPPELPADDAAEAPPPASVVEPTSGSAETVIDELALRRRRRSRRILTLAVAAAMVIALSLGGWVVSLVQQRQAQVAESNLETQLLSAPDAKVVAVTTQSGLHTSFVVSKSLNKAMFVGDDLPSAGAGKKYQLWTIGDDAKAIPDSLFDGGSARKAWFSGDIKAAASLGVTIEPSGGSSQPTLPLVASAKI